MMISFVICHDKQARGGGKKEHERQKDEGGIRPRLHWSQNRYNTTVWTDSKQASRYQQHYVLCQRYTETDPTGMLSPNHGRLFGTNRVGFFSKRHFAQTPVAVCIGFEYFCNGQNVSNRTC